MNDDAYSVFGAQAEKKAEAAENLQQRVAGKVSFDASLVFVLSNERELTLFLCVPSPQPATDQELLSQLMYLYSRRRGLNHRLEDVSPLVRWRFVFVRLFGSDASFPCSFFPFVQPSASVPPARSRVRTAPSNPPSHRARHRDGRLEDGHGTFGPALGRVLGDGSHLPQSAVAHP